MKNPNNRLWILAGIFWTLVIAIFFWHEESGNRNDILKGASIEARSSFNKDLVYRRWAASHGGVYVPVTEQTPPNPYLQKIPERDIETPSGKKLTLVNPAYMTRQVYQIADEQYGIKGHITSLNPLRPENKADAWETQALQSFDNGTASVEAIKTIEGEEFLRAMYPLVTEESCLECHSDQGYKVGDIRGGISTSVPMAPYLSVYRAALPTRIAFHAGLWLLGIAAVLLARSKIKNQHLRIETALGKSGKTEQALRESEGRFKALHEASFGGIIIHDKGVILDCNQGLADMTGFPLKELIGMDGLQLIAPDSINQVLQNIKRGYEQRYEVDGVRKDGSVYPLAIRGKNVIYKDREARVIEFRDISEIKLAEQEKEIIEAILQQSQKMEAIGTMAGGIAHDFNNLLAVISGNIDMIQQKDNVTDRDAEKNIDHIKMATVRASSLVKQILSFSRQEKHDLAPIDLAFTVNESLKLLRSTIPTTVEIMNTVDSAPVFINADMTQLQQVFMNLCTNAVHSMNEKGLLRINLQEVELADQELPTEPDQQAGSYAKLSVSDTGTGIDQETLDKIFDPFFTTKGLGEGTGMGLSVVYGIIKQHSGFITVDSTPGLGSAFNLYFPASSETPAELKDELDTSLPVGIERVMVVDDEEAVAAICSEMLEHQGYIVTCVTSSLKALEIFKKSPQEFDLIFTDQTMPEMSGTELATALLKIRKDLPIVLCSGYSAQVSEENAKGIGIREYCMKPMTMENLTTVARRVLDESGKPT